MPTQRTFGFAAFAAVSVIVGCCFMTVGGMAALFVSAGWLSSSPEAGASPPDLLLVVAAAWAVGTCLCAAPIGLWTGQVWAVPVGVAGQCGVAMVGIATWIADGDIGTLMAFSAISVLSLAYLSRHASARVRPRPSLAEPSIRWVSRFLVVTAWLDLSIVLTSPLGLVGVGFAYMNNERSAADLDTLTALLLWLSVLAGLKLVAWRQFSRGGPGARRVAEVVVVCTALGAALPWTGWLRAIPICDALAILALLVASDLLPRSRRAQSHAVPDLKSGA
ncbi:MAG TPA: hypothetical protein VF337_11580 [Candidatus Limnocylindrales bacterium]